jgi:dTDP-4-dehydrorhamnose 3,5-epimerase
MELIPTKLEGVTLLKPTEIYEDFRGRHREIFNEALFLKAGLATHFVQEDCSRSSRGVLRGLHGDRKAWKLISCLQGKVYVAVVHPESGKWEGFTLSDANQHSLLVPPGYASGHMILSEEALFHYKQTEYPSPENQFGHRFDDPKFNVWWPLQVPLISRKDEQL